MTHYWQVIAPINDNLGNLIDIRNRVGDYYILCPRAKTAQIMDMSHKKTVEKIHKIAMSYIDNPYPLW